jgi:4-hydroxy-tetrahydrodipicolinate reductase
VSDTAALVVHGAGRMGQEVFMALARQPRYTLQAVVSPARPAWLESGPWFSSLQELQHKPAVVVDFSAAAAITGLAGWCAAAGVALLSGTTALHAEHYQALKQAAEHVPVLHAANFSRGVNTLLMLTSQAAQALPDVQRVVITDIHHRHKKDAPSGTALALQAELGGFEVSIESLREGEVAGEHRVRFEWPGEVLELRHEAGQRAVFAEGALQAAAWLCRQPAGRFAAQDWVRHG